MVSDSVLLMQQTCIFLKSLKLIYGLVRKSDTLVLNCPLCFTASKSIWEILGNTFKDLLFSNDELSSKEVMVFR